MMMDLLVCGPPPCCVHVAVCVCVCIYMCTYVCLACMFALNYAYYDCVHVLRMNMYMNDVHAVLFIC